MIQWYNETEINVEASVAPLRSTHRSILLQAIEETVFREYSWRWVDIFLSCLECNVDHTENCP